MVLFYNKGLSIQEDDCLFSMLTEGVTRAIWRLGTCEIFPRRKLPLHSNVLVISLIKRHTDTNAKKYLLFFIEVKTVKEKFIANMSLWHAAL